MNEYERRAWEPILESLRQEKVREGLAISLYVPFGQVAKAQSLLASERSLARNIHDRVTRKAVEAAIDSASRGLSLSERDANPNGLAIFAIGPHSRTFRAPEPVLSFLYKCSRALHLAPLEQMLLPRQVTGLVVLDRSEATIGWTDGYQVRVSHHYEGFVMGKHHMGGMSQHRYQELIQQQAEAFFKTVGEQANAVFLPMLGTLTEIVVGGPSMTKQEWRDGEYLDHRLRQLLRKGATYGTGYTDEQGLKELCVRANLLRNPPSTIVAHRAGFAYAMAVQRETEARKTFFER